MNTLRLFCTVACGMFLPVVAWSQAKTTPSVSKQRQTPTNVYAAEGYRLVWSDEFDKPGSPDPKNWGYEEGFVRNEEAQWYQKENARVENGMLIIEARKERKLSPDYKPGSTDWKTARQFAEYTSSCLQSQGKREFRYGRFEARARIDTRPGSWPAFWTLGATGHWPMGGEIDILEYYRYGLHANTAWGAGGWKAKWDATEHPIGLLGGPDWGTQFHVWRMDWEEKAIRLYVDDQLLNETDVTQTVNENREAGDAVNPFQQPQYLLLNLAVGGQSGGDEKQTRFPVRYEVDYVRVYQK